MKENTKTSHTVVQVYYDHDGYLVSTIKINNKEKNLSNWQTKKLMKELDEEKYDSVNLTSDTIRLKTKDALVVIYDVRDMLRDNTFTLLPKTFPLIQEEIRKYNRRAAQNRKRKNIQRGRRRVAATALVLLLLASAAISFNHKKDKDTYDNTYTSNVFNSANHSSVVEDIMGNIESQSDPEEEDFYLNNLPSEEELNTLISELDDEVPENATYFNFKTTNDLEKKEFAYNNFYSLVEQAANKYGISPNLPMAMLTQESGGKEENLMQIEFDQWLDMPLKIFNFEKNQYDYFVLTDNPENYQNTNYTTISRKDILNPKINIEMGCIITRKSAEMMNYHIMAGVQCYNLGAGNMETVLAETSRNTGQEVLDILSDQTNSTFVEYTHIPGVGDKDYLSHVFQFLDENDSTITFKHLDSEGNIVTEKITLFGENNKSLN